MSDVQSYKAKTKYGFLTSLKTIVSGAAKTPVACKLNIRDACSPLSASLNFEYKQHKSDATHVAIVLFQNGSSDADKQYVVLRSLKDNQKMLLHGPAETFPERRQFLKLEYARFTR